MHFLIVLPLGFLVIMPDWYRGTLQDPADGIPPLVEFIKRESQWEKLAKDWEEKVRPYAEKHGAKVFGTIGENKLTVVVGII